MESESVVKVLRAIPELEEIREVWESWPGNRDSEMESYLTFLRTHPGAVRPHVLVVYRQARPDAILVGRIDDGQIRYRLGYLGMCSKARIMCFVYGALRGNPSKANCELLVNEILRSLSLGEADVAYLNFLRKGSDLCRLATKKPALLCRDYIRTAQPHFTAALPATPEEFYRGLSPKVRKNQKWQAKKLVSHFSGAVRIRCFREVAELDQMIQDVEHIAKRSYQRGLGVGFVDSPATREGLRLKAEKGWLRGHVLYLAERPCAFWLGDVNRTTLGSDYVGYDSEFASHSPGMYLFMKVIEGLCNGNSEGVTEIDFATGYAQYKEVLSNRKWEEESVYIFAPSIKGISLNLIRSLVCGIDLALKKVLARTNLLQRIKKKWRARAIPQEAAQGHERDGSLRSN
jgi:hypothetical protein